MSSISLWRTRAAGNSPPVERGRPDAPRVPPSMREGGGGVLLPGGTHRGPVKCQLATNRLTALHKALSRPPEDRRGTPFTIYLAEATRRRDQTDALTIGLAAACAA